METLPEISEISLATVSLADSPFPHFSVNQLLNNTKSEELLNWFKNSHLWSFTETDFYSQYEFSLVGLDLPGSLAFLTSETTQMHLADRFGNIFGKKLKVIDITAHKLIDGHRMGVHNDFIGEAETHRLVIQINDRWTEKNGGYLMLFNSKAPADVAAVVQPLHNTGIGFEISDRSFHAVSTVHEFTRYTLVYTFNETY